MIKDVKLEHKKGKRKRKNEKSSIKYEEEADELTPNGSRKKPVSILRDSDDSVEFDGNEYEYDTETISQEDGEAPKSGKKKKKKKLIDLKKVEEDDGRAPFERKYKARKLKMGNDEDLDDVILPSIGSLPLLEPLKLDLFSMDHLQTEADEAEKGAERDSLRGRKNSGSSLKK
jgi:hypothetical protein